MVSTLVGPVAGRALPVAFKLSGRIIPAIQARSAAAVGGGLFGIGWKGLITQGLAVWAGMEALDALISVFNGDENEAAKVAAILAAIEDGMDSGAIFMPEPPRGYEGTTYLQKLNYFHAEVREPNLWWSDNYCKHVGRGR